MPPTDRRMRLPHGEADPAKRYSMPDPDELHASYERVYRARWYGGPAASEDDIAYVLTLAGGYLDLTTYTLGQECCVGKLRDIWRARRARREDETDEAD